MGNIDVDATALLLAADTGAAHRRASLRGGLTATKCLLCVMVKHRCHVKEWLSPTRLDRADGVETALAYSIELTNCYLL
jgi:hypothetical protein